VDKPVKPIMLLNMILAVVGGFILSLIYAFSADHFDHSLKSIDGAERYLGVPVLASVPKLGRRMIRAKGGV
jgi:capsular polysaccharide biosynthesis protein